MALEVNFFNIRSTLEDIEDEQKKEKLVKECLTEHFLAPCPPFSIINPSQIKVNRDGKKLLGRNYGWGFADCFNPDNSDFSRLHKLVLRHVRSELIATTQQKYKNFDNDLAVKEAANKQPSLASNGFLCAALVGLCSIGIGWRTLSKKS